MLKLHHAPNSRAGDDMPHLNAYIDRLEARPAFQKGVQTQVHGDLETVIENSDRKPEKKDQP